MQHAPPPPRPPGTRAAFARPGSPRPKRTDLCLGLLLLALGAPAARAQAPSWPEVALPAQAQSYGVGQQLGMNGLPMRLTGFATEAAPEQTAAWFRRTLGQPLVENRLGRKQILGRAEGGYYLTVQIEPGSDGRGSRGMVAVTQLPGAPQPQTRETIAHWRRLLPAGTQVTSHLQAQDNGRFATHLVALNRHGEQLNAQRLGAALREQGYALERSISTDSAQTAAGLPEQAAGLTLLFRGPGKEAMATITRDAQGQTSIVLLTSVQLELLP
ncbi:hypothetical protein [Verminephrobacter aporrectodeae]|uniref:hypothetical protein n=1 Tax=Verminephrobacter aporrectodeae TaxID=1110389 RepID=UPI002238BC40|nr:hypothetical protein [Verminephrobacter aporrectodeae]